MSDFLKARELLSFSLASNSVFEKEKERFISKVDRLEPSFTKFPYTVSYFELPDKTKYGKCLFYYIDGEKMAECNFVNGKVDGKYTIWSKSGGIWCEADIVQGKLNGSRTFYDIQRICFRREIFRKGVLFEKERASLYSSRNYSTLYGKNKTFSFSVKKEWNSDWNLKEHKSSVFLDTTSTKKCRVMPFVDDPEIFHSQQGIFATTTYHDNGDIHTRSEIIQPLSGCESLSFINVG